MNAPDQGPSKDLRLAFFLNFGFTLFEVVGGILTNSLLLLSDAVHDLGDSISLGLAWFLERYASRESDDRYSYGYRRFSLLGALINTLILTLGAIFVISRAIPRLIDPQPVEARGLVLFAVIGVTVNGFAVFRLRSRSGLNTRTVALHLLEDMLGWVAVLALSIAILIDPRATILDPLLSIVISLFVLFNVFRNLRTTMKLFLQGVPDEVDVAWLQDELREIRDVESIHHTHVWSLDGEKHVLTSHVVVREGASKLEAFAIKQKVRLLLEDLDLAHSTVEIEFGDGDCGLKA